MELAARVGGEIQYMVELSVVPVMKVLTMCALGSLLAQPRINIITPAATRLLSKLVFALFLPCLIFTELGEYMTLGNMLEWWFIPVNVVICYFIGCIAGVFVALICKPPPEFFRFTVVMTGIGNAGNLPLAIIGSICHGQDQPFGKKYAILTSMSTCVGMFFCVCLSLIVVSFQFCLLLFVVRSGDALKVCSVVHHSLEGM